MGAKKIIFLFFGGAAAWWIWQKYNFYQKVQFSISTISVDGSFFSPKIILTLILTNPTNVNTTISNINAQLYLNGNNKIADIYYNDKLEILANSKTLLPLTINPTLSSIITTINEVLINKNGYFDLKGNATVDGLNIPFDINYKL
jgi:hypothetical protein